MAVLDTNLAFEKFLREMKDRFEKDREKNLYDWMKDPIMHLETRLYDQVIVYMGDKEAERRGDPEELVDMANLAMFIWWRKKEKEEMG